MTRYHPIAGGDLSFFAMHPPHESSSFCFPFFGAEKRGPTGLFTGAGVGDAAVSTGSGEGPGRRPQRFMEAKFGGFHRENGGKTLAHTIHVWYIYLHEWLIFNQMLVNIPYMDAMGWEGTLNNQPH